MLDLRWANVFDAGPALIQHWVSVSSRLRVSQPISGFPEVVFHLWRAELTAWEHDEATREQGETTPEQGETTRECMVRREWGHVDLPHSHCIYYQGHCEGHIPPWAEL